jgi:hypothetical protein
MGRPFSCRVRIGTACRDRSPNMTHISCCVGTDTMTSYPCCVSATFLVSHIVLPIVSEPIWTSIAADLWWRLKQFRLYLLDAHRCTFLAPRIYKIVYAPSLRFHFSGKIRVREGFPGSRIWSGCTPDLSRIFSPSRLHRTVAHLVPSPPRAQLPPFRSPHAPPTPAVQHAPPAPTRRTAATQEAPIHLRRQFTLAAAQRDALRCGGHDRDPGPDGRWRGVRGRRSGGGGRRGAYRPRRARSPWTTCPYPPSTRRSTGRQRRAWRRLLPPGPADLLLAALNLWWASVLFPRCS